jgi:rhodanese-related sulfurtransferase
MHINGAISDWHHHASFRAIISIVKFSNSKLWSDSMNTLSEILENAEKRASAKNLPYKGELTPREAFELLQHEPSTVLVDVRSRAELELVGRIPSAAHIEWAFYPGMTPNHAFAEQLINAIDKDLTVVFACRTGGRSHNAALVAQQLGYSKAYNMLEGFEGDMNSLNQRMQINGWKHAGLPWHN